MTESQLLDSTIDLLKEDDTLEAYEFLVTNLNQLDELSGQVYNFLYCLAATSNKRLEALDWMEEAIVNKGLWYRSEVFEDDDLDSIRDDVRYAKYLELSNSKYIKALESTKPVFTWKNKVSDSLITVLHGNQQNNRITETYWSDLELPSIQIEYLQSEEIDSYQLYRWEDEGNGPDQLENALSLISLDDYRMKVLSGFSAGCNTILRYISVTEQPWDKVVLQSPWIPCIEDNLEDIISALLAKNIEVLLICGLDDEDCLPQCLKFEAKAKELGLKINVNYFDGLGHNYPNDFKELLLKFL